MGKLTIRERYVLINFMVKNVHPRGYGLVKFEGLVWARCVSDVAYNNVSRKSAFTTTCTLTDALGYLTFARNLARPSIRLNMT